MNTTQCQGAQNIVHLNDTRTEFAGLPLARGARRALAGWGMILIVTGSGRAAAQLAVPDTASTAAPLVFEGVTVVDVAQGKLVPDQRVVIVGTHITAVAPRRGAPPAGARVVGAAGKYLIPGLWDMHVHVDNDADELYPKFIAYGITGLREMAQRFPNGSEVFRTRQREIMAGARVGPRVYGPSFDMCAPRPDPYSDVMRTPELARHIADSLKAVGMVFLKIHSCFIPRDNYFTIAREARRVGLQFVGHLPKDVTEIEALDSGQTTIEHFGDANKACWPHWPQPLDAGAEQRCAPTAAAYRRNHAWLTPTLIAAKCAFPAALQDAKQYVGILYRAGVPILAGTDYPGLINCGNAYPPLHEELAFLVGAGLTPLEALRTATLNPAEYMHATDSLGTVAPGKLADLVLLDADPLADIHHTRQIRAVVANGRYFDSTALAALQGNIPAPQVAALEPAEDVDTQAVYVGYRRAARFVSPEGLSHDALVTYTAPTPAQLIERGAWGLVGPWRVTSEKATLVGGPGKLVLRFRARHLSILFSPVLDSSGRVLDSTTVQFRVRVDGQPPENDDRATLSPDGEGTMKWGVPFAERIWDAMDRVLVSQQGPLHDQTLEIEFLTPVTIYELTFDPGS